MNGPSIVLWRSATVTDNNQSRLPQDIVTSTTDVLGHNDDYVRHSRLMKGDVTSFGAGVYHGVITREAPATGLRDATATFRYHKTAGVKV